MITKEQWTKYLMYLKGWIKDHKDIAFAGMSPVGFDEWLENEFEEDDE